MRTTKPDIKLRLYRVVDRIRPPHVAGFITLPTISSSPKNCDHPWTSSHVALAAISALNRTEERRVSALDGSIAKLRSASDLGCCFYLLVLTALKSPFGPCS